MMKSNLDKLLHAREISGNRAQLNRVGDRLRKRLAHLFEAGLQHSEQTMDSQTDRINRLLVLWLDLQNAVRNTPLPHRVPWECDDEKVVFLWDQIAHPKNQRGLEEWLFQVPSGESESWAQRALLECRSRCREAGRPPD